MELLPLSLGLIALTLALGKIKKQKFILKIYTYEYNFLFLLKYKYNQWPTTLFKWNYRFSGWNYCNMSKQIQTFVTQIYLIIFLNEIIFLF